MCTCAGSSPFPVLFGLLRFRGVPLRFRVEPLRGPEITPRTPLHNRADRRIGPRMTNMSKDLTEKKSTPRHAFRAGLGMVWRSSPRLTVMWSRRCSRGSVIPAFLALAIRGATNAVTAGANVDAIGVAAHVGAWMLAGLAAAQRLQPRARRPHRTPQGPRARTRAAYRGDGRPSDASTAPASTTTCTAPPTTSPSAP